MTVRELLARIDSRELSEWMAYERISGPLGGRRTDIAAAIGASATANANRSRRKPYKVTDFLPTWDRPKQSPEDMWSRVVAMNERMGGVTRAV